MDIFVSTQNVYNSIFFYFDFEMFYYSDGAVYAKV